jgi:hypothetical protein
LGARGLFTVSVENPVEKNRSGGRKPRDPEHFSGLHHRSAKARRAIACASDDARKTSRLYFWPMSSFLSGIMHE